jgi:tetrahydromethanopterin S-methyltransferase subunit F
MRFFIPSLTGMVGFWATVALNIPDFTRYARSQKAQMIGQALGLPPAMTIYSFIGVAVTSASVILFGHAIWDPVALLARFHEPVIASIALVALLVATLNTNVAANVVSPSNDFSNLNPRLISFRTGGLITGVVAVLMMPWRLLTDFQSYIFGWLVGYSGLLGPIAGIMITDYFLLRHTYLDVDELYNPAGIYRYGSGVNYRAIVALAAGIVVALIGLVVPPLRWLYDYAWFVGFLVASLAYWISMRNAKGLARLACCLLAFLPLVRAQRSDQPPDSARLAQYRNLGKAFYENPTTYRQAVEEFRLALALAPNSVREQLGDAALGLTGSQQRQSIVHLGKTHPHPSRSSGPAGLNSRSATWTLISS